MNKVEQQLSCGTCSWDKKCIYPPSVTSEYVDNELSKPPKPGEEDKGLIQLMIKTLFLAGKEYECYVCPLVADRLRQSPEIANIIRNYMKGL